MRAICICILCVTVLQGYAPRIRAETINGIQAVVHDSVITRDEVAFLNQQTYEALRRQYAGQPDVFEKKMAEMERENLDTLINRQLVLHDFKTAGYTMPQSVLDEIVEERIRSRYVDRVKLIKTLEAEGMTYEKFRDQERDNFVIEALRAKNVAQEILISPHKVEVYYEAHKDDADYKVEDEVKLRLIVLNKSPDTNAPQASGMAKEILTRLDEGTSFEEMAKLYSPNSPTNGNRFERSELRKELADVAFTLKPGQHSGVVDTPEACYLMLLQETSPAHTKPLSEVRDQIERSLLLAEQKRLEQQWYDRLKKKTFVQYH
jgi:parvulin-like peptidyl-prolyl isomerase